MNYLEYIEDRDRYATGAVAANCIASLFECLEVNGVDLKLIPKMNSSIALRRGLPFSYFDKSSYCHEIFSKLCKEYFKSYEFNENHFAEVSSAALLLALNAKHIEPIKQTSSKSYDFDVSWGEEVIEVEVTRPGEKDAWAQRLAQAQRLANYANGLSREFSINIYLTEILCNDENAQLQSLIFGLKVGERTEEKGKWLLFSEEPYGAPHVLFENVVDRRRPEWWPQNAINGFCVAGMLASPTQKEPLPRVNVKFSCPFHGYINRAKQKATNFQGTRSRPFMLILDANVLGNPFDELARKLEHYFKKWKHMTAVLVYVDFYSRDEVGWEFQLFLNPHATRKLDKFTEQQLSELTERKRAVKKYA